VGGVGQESGPLKDGFQQFFLIEAVDEAEGGFVQSGEMLVLAAQDGDLPPQAGEVSFRFLHRTLLGDFVRWRDRHSCISDGSFGFQPNGLDASGPPVEADGHFSLCENDRHAALVVRVFQHVGHPGLVPQDVHELHRMAFPRIGFTSRPGIRSGILAEDQNGFGHFSLPNLYGMENYQPFATLSMNTAWAILEIVACFGFRI